MNSLQIAGIVLVILASTGAWLDLTARRLPNWLCLATALAGLAVSLALHGPSGAGSGLLHGLVALAMGMALFGCGLVGGGDAKFYSALALWFGIGSAARLLLGVSVSGLVLFALWFAGRRVIGRKVERRPEKDSDKFPYGIAIAAGAVLTWFTQPGLTM